jgi:hypothetical protein
VLPRLFNGDQAILALLFPERDYWRPKTRADCAKVKRPCPYVACRYNLYLETTQGSPSIVVNHPDEEPADLVHSCALDIAEGEEHDGYQTDYHCTLAKIAEILGLSRERVRQIERDALAKIRRSDATAFQHRDNPPWLPKRFGRQCSGF